MFTKELGWPGHYCLAHECMFRRNTYVGNGFGGYLVSTVGRRYRDGKVEPVGCDRCYETLVFKCNKPYEPEYDKEIPIRGNIFVLNVDENSDFEANENHENAVKYIMCLYRELSEGE